MCVGGGGGGAAYRDAPMHHPARMAKGEGARYGAHDVLRIVLAVHLLRPTQHPTRTLFTAAAEHAHDFAAGAHPLKQPAEQVAASTELHREVEIASAAGAARASSAGTTHGAVPAHRSSSSSSSMCRTHWSS